MKHLCNCGEIVNAEGNSLLIATCPNCGMYYLYKSELIHPHNEEQLLKDIQSKVHSHKEVVEELLLDDEVTPYIYIPDDEKFEDKDDEEMPVKVKPRAAKRR